MNTFAYILGSGMMENPYILPCYFLLLLACLMAWLACRIQDNGNEGKKYLVYVFAFLSSASILSGIYLLKIGWDEKKQEKPPSEQLEYDNHYHDYKGGVLT